MTAPKAFPLAWPDALPRTQKRITSPFKLGLDRAVADLQDALRLFGADTGLPVRNVVISSNVTLGCRRPADPGVAVYFEWDGADRCIAVDRFRTAEANVRAIYHILESRRQEMRCGGLLIVRAAFQGFAALPPARDWRGTLGLGPWPTLADVEARHRALSRAHHPDRGGSDERMAEINAARDAARKELSDHV